MTVGSSSPRVLIIACAAAAIALTAPAAAGQPGTGESVSPGRAAATDADLDAYLQDQVDQFGLPGAAAAVVRDGVIEHLVAVGEADDTGRPLTPQTPVHLASLSKGFAALAVMQLVQAGKVELDAPVQRYLPWFRVADEAASARITVEQCLHHTSGIPHDFDIPIRLLTEEITGPSAIEQGVRALSTVTLRDTPGASPEYTNLGYNTVGAVVEAVSGEHYGDYLAGHVFGPLGMTHTYTTIDQARRDGLAEGFSTLFSVYRERPAATPEALQPSATTFSSAEDLAHEIEMYLAHGSYHGTTVINPATEKTLHAPGPTFGPWSYSMGWWLRPQWELSTQPGDPAANAGLDTVVETVGDWDNTTTYMGYVPTTGTGLVVLINAGSETQHSELRGIEENAWRVLLGVPTVPVVPQEEFLQRYGWQIAAGFVLLELLAAGATFLALRRRSRRNLPRTGRVRIRWLGAPLLLDLTVLLLGLVLIPAHFDTGFDDLVNKTTPDVAGLILAAVGIAAVSAVTRIVLLIRTAIGRRRTGTAPPEPTLGPPALTGTSPAADGRTRSTP
jgi:CubicO group peptidase (beta-lactamase class C family)